MLVVSRLSEKKMKGQPWWGWCCKCMVKHCLLLLLNVMVDVRKVCEEMYLEERWKMYMEEREGENASSKH